MSSTIKVYRFTVEIDMAVPTDMIDPLTAAVILMDATLEEIPPVLSMRGVTEPVLTPEDEAEALLRAADLVETV